MQGRFKVDMRKVESCFGQIGIRSLEVKSMGSPNFGSDSLLPCFFRAGMGPCLVQGRRRVSIYSRLGVHSKGPWFGP